MSYTAGEVSARIRKVMDDLGLKQADLVRMTGLSRATISRICTGERRADFDTLKILADATGVSIIYFTGGTEPDDFLDPDIKTFFEQTWKRLPLEDKTWLRGTIDLLRRKVTE